MVVDNASIEEVFDENKFVNHLLRLWPYSQMQLKMLGHTLSSTLKGQIFYLVKEEWEANGVSLQLIIVLKIYLLGSVECVEWVIYLENLMYIKLLWW